MTYICHLPVSLALVHILLADLVGGHCEVERVIRVPIQQINPHLDGLQFQSIGTLGI